MTNSLRVRRGYPFVFIVANPSWGKSIVFVVANPFVFFVANI